MVNRLLSNGLINRYDYKRIKDQVDENIKSKYELYYYDNLDKEFPKIENNELVINDDSNTEVNKFYKELCSCSKYFTEQELKYFFYYINGYSEEEIAEEYLFMTRSSLRKIKQSAILKVAFYFRLNMDF